MDTRRVALAGRCGDSGPAPRPHISQKRYSSRIQPKHNSQLDAHTQTRTEQRWLDWNFSGFVSFLNNIRTLQIVQGSWRRSKMENCEYKLQIKSSNVFLRWKQTGKYCSGPAQEPQSFNPVMIRKLVVQTTPWKLQLPTWTKNTHILEKSFKLSMYEHTNWGWSRWYLYYIYFSPF